MKFFSIKVGDTFFIEEITGPANAPRTNSSVCQKISALAYNIQGESVLGEHTIDPRTDALIVTNEEKAAQAKATKIASKPSPKPAVKQVKGKKSVAKKVPAKKTAKKSIAKKTTKKKK